MSALQSPAAHLSIEPLDLGAHLRELHAWVTHPRSVYWQMQGASPLDVAEEYSQIEASKSHDAWLGRADGEPSFLVETYLPQSSELAQVPEAAALLQPGDLGMHVLVAPPVGEPRSGFTAEVMRTVMEFCFARAEVARVVVEPDVRNERIAALNAAVGFRVLGEVALASKTAALSACTRDDFAASRLGRGWTA